MTRPRRFRTVDDHTNATFHILYQNPNAVWIYCPPASQQNSEKYACHKRNTSSDVLSLRGLCPHPQLGALPLKAIEAPGSYRDQSPPLHFLSLNVFKINPHFLSNCGNRKSRKTKQSLYLLGESKTKSTLSSIEPRDIKPTKTKLHESDLFVCHWLDQAGPRRPSLWQPFVIGLVVSQFLMRVHRGRRPLCRGYMWNKIISKLFQRLIATLKYFPTCSMSLK